MATCIVDGHYLLHRVLHIPQVRMLATKENKPTGGVFEFIRCLRATIAEWSEIRKVVVVFDGRHSERRKELYPGYKKRDRSKEQEVDPDGLTYSQKFNMQLNYLKFVLPRLGVRVVVLQNREGDDVIALLARNLKDPLKIVMSDDKDMYQLVDEDVHIWRPIAKVRVSLDNFEEEVGCSKKNFLLKKSILGDPSDKIPGVKGVGPKTIDTVLKQCPDIGPYPHEKFFETAIDMKGKKIQSIVSGLDDILRNYKLIDMTLEEITEDEITHALDNVNKSASLDVLAVKRVFIGFEFFSLLNDYSIWITPFQLLK